MLATEIYGSRKSKIFTICPSQNFPLPEREGHRDMDAVTTICGPEGHMHSEEKQLCSETWGGGGEGGGGGEIMQERLPRADKN